MSEMIVSAGVPEVTMGTGSLAGPSVPPTFSGKWSDMASDLAAIGKELNVAPPPTQPDAGQPTQAVVTPTPQATPANAPQTQAAPHASAPAAVPAAPVSVEVPEKFRGPDGKLDQEKVLKSYSDAERALKKAQNALNQPQTQTPAQPAAVPQTSAPVNPANLTPFEIQVARDLWQNGQAGFTEAQAVSLARVQIRGWEAQHQATISATSVEVGKFGEVLAEQQRRDELTALAKTNPEVLTPQGYAELVRVREENPEINQAANPWTKAVKILLGERMMKGQAGTVTIPTPTGSQQSQPLPVMPSGPASNPIQLNTPDQVEAHVKGLTPDQEKEFWTKAGFKWDMPRAQFKGL